MIWTTQKGKKCGPKFLELVPYFSTQSSILVLDKFGNMAI